MARCLRWLRRLGNQVVRQSALEHLGSWLCNLEFRHLLESMLAGPIIKSDIAAFRLEKIPRRNSAGIVSQSLLVNVSPMANVRLCV
jgi:hypothetical protein